MGLLRPHLFPLLRSYSARLLSSSSFGTAACYDDERPAQGLRTLYYIRMGAQERETAEPHSATVESEEGVQRPWWRRVFGR